LRDTRHQLVWLLGIAGALLVVRYSLRALDMEYCLTQLTMALYYSMVVLGLCLVMGYCGQVSLGHGAFFAIGGYTTAVLTTAHFDRLARSPIGGWLQDLHVLVARQDAFGHPAISFNPWAGFMAAMGLTAVIALLIGYPALRLKGHYLAMATLGFGLIVNKLVLGTAALGAADGINGVPRWTLLPGLIVSGRSEHRVANFYIAAVLLLVVLWLLRNLVRSRIGRALLAIHDRETAANAMGINTAGLKLKTFLLSALLAASAGVLFTHYTGGIGPSESGVMKSVRYLALTAAGGMANLWGACVVSTLLNYLSLRGLFGTFDHAVFGVLLIVMISVAPEGPLRPIGVWLRAQLLRCKPERRPSHGPA